MNPDVFVVVEHLAGRLADISFELLGKGRELADTRGGRLSAVVLGHGVQGLADLGIADRVIVADHPGLEHFNPEAYGAALAEIVRKENPGVTLLATSSMGMDMAGALSVALGVPLVAYALDVKPDGDGLLVTSQLYGGKLNVESRIDASSAVISMLAGATAPDKGRRQGGPAATESHAPESLGQGRVRFLRLIQPEDGGVDITAQDILVSVGRGIQSADNLPLVEELAQTLGGALAASRPIVDSKWLPKTRQVGKSGVKVKPRLYLSVGISGAPEHIEGMKDAELIIAINSDPNAPIFDYAHYGVSADLFDVVPALSAKLKG